MGIELKDKKCIVTGQNGVLKCVTSKCPRSPHKSILSEECLKIER